MWPSPSPHGSRWCWIWFRRSTQRTPCRQAREEPSKLGKTLVTELMCSRGRSHQTWYHLSGNIGKLAVYCLLWCVRWYDVVLGNKTMNININHTAVANFELVMNHVTLTCNQLSMRKCFEPQTVWDFSAILFNGHTQRDVCHRFLWAPKCGRTCCRPWDILVHIFTWNLWTWSDVTRSGMIERSVSNVVLTWLSDHDLNNTGQQESRIVSLSYQHSKP